MNITCPNDPKHITFHSTAHTWKVSNTGEFIDDVGCDLIHSPDQNDLFTCAICGEEAKIEKD